MTDGRLLDRLGADGCPPLEQVEVEGWRLRASAGVLLRANSALPLSDALPVDEVVDFYRARDLPPRVHVSARAVDEALAARGWERGFEVTVLAGPTPTGPSSARVSAEPDARWIDVYWWVDGRGGAAEREVFTRMLGRLTAPVAYASVSVDGALAAVGRAVAQEGHLGVFAMAVLPAFRRRGLGREILHALGSWGMQQGASVTHLQVLRDNVSALALYAASGLVPVHGYHYRTLT